ncbi:MAG: sigma-70 family RNA polymerase sigma factor [Gemmatales bacterium]|nr:sigma-70 family RNA polymerase sigma factor [Gemmatales bacterium]MDW8385651.1 sigma-70 family RNA polymerase sigma factor [Gemmatales bacterium]
MPNESDRLLVQAMRQGDESAWRQLFERYYDRLFYYARSKLGDENLAEDVVQETFMGLLRSLDNYDESRDLANYLYTIARNKIMDRHRQMGRTPEQPLDPFSDSAASDFEPSDGRPRASTMARSKERREGEERALVFSLSNLIKEWKSKGDYQRLMVLELLFVKRWANKDIAAHLNIPDQQVANIRFAAIRKLAEAVKTYGLPPEVLSKPRRSR